MNDLTPSEKALFIALKRVAINHICTIPRDILVASLGYADHGSCSRLFKSLRTKQYINYVDGVRKHIEVLK